MTMRTLSPILPWPARTEALRQWLRAVLNDAGNASSYVEITGRHTPAAGGTAGTSRPSETGHAAG